MFIVVYHTNTHTHTHTHTAQTDLACCLLTRFQRPNYLCEEMDWRDSIVLFQDDGQQQQQRLVNKQFNSPMALYSEETIAETLSSQAEVLAQGVLG